MRATTVHHPRGAGRTGFTLIEILVVIAIVAAIIALTASAVFRAMLVQQENNTKSTLSRAQGALNNAWSKVKDQANAETTIPPNVDAWIRSNLAGSDANATGRVRVIYVKLRLKQAFPMSFAEALNPAPLPPLPAYTLYLSGLGVQPNTSYGNFESSACLLMALQRGVSGTGFDPSDLAKGGAAGNGNLPKGTIPYLMDAWGSPIYFSRVPVGSPKLNANPYPGPGQVGNNDPLDPQGYLNSSGWAQQFGNTFTQVTLQRLAGGNSSYKIAPLLASPGVDKTPQFDPVTFQPTPGADDIFSTP